MAMYAGETTTFKVSATQVDDSRTVLLDTDVTSTEIVILDANGTEVVASTPMVWDTTDQEWRYTWQTTDPGKFVARLRLTGPTFDVWEYQKVSIKVNPDPWPVP
jgi:hypothetical protein